MLLEQPREIVGAPQLEDDAQQAASHVPRAEVEHFRREGEELQREWGEHCWKDLQSSTRASPLAREEDDAEDEQRQSYWYPIPGEECRTGRPPPQERKDHAKRQPSGESEAQREGLALFGEGWFRN